MRFINKTLKDHYDKCMTEFQDNPNMIQSITAPDIYDAEQVEKTTSFKTSQGTLVAMKDDYIFSLNGERKFVVHANDINRQWIES